MTHIQCLTCNDSLNAPEDGVEEGPCSCGGLSVIGCELGVTVKAAPGTEYSIQ